MREFEKKRRFRKIFFSRPVFALLLAILVFLFLNVLDMYKKSRRAVLRNKAVESEIVDITQRKEELAKDLSALRTDFGKEQMLRDKFQLKKPGEHYVVILDTNSPKPPLKSPQPKNSFFKKIIEFFDIF